METIIVFLTKLQVSVDVSLYNNRMLGMTVAFWVYYGAAGSYPRYGLLTKLATILNDKNKLDMDMTTLPAFSRHCRT